MMIISYHTYVASYVSRPSVLASRATSTYAHYYYVIMILSYAHNTYMTHDMVSDRATAAPHIN